MLCWAKNPTADFQHNLQTFIQKSFYPKYGITHWMVQINMGFDLNITINDEIFEGL